MYMESEFSKRLKKEEDTRSRPLRVKERKNVKEIVNNVKYGRNIYLNKT